MILHEGKVLGFTPNDMPDPAVARERGPVTLESFLASVERRAFITARIATRNPEEALDIVQDAMLQLVKSYRARAAQEWGALFHTILQSRIRDWYRRNTVRNRWRQWLGSSDTEDETDPLQNFPDTARPGPVQGLQNARLVTALEAALGRLPPRQQQAFLLRVWEGLDVAGTARAMQCSQGSVKTHYSRAVHRLRELLREYGTDESE